MSTDGQDYGVGGTYGTGEPSDAGQCAETCICTALDSGLAAISDALDEINNTLGDMIADSCTIVDDCSSEIIALVDGYFRGVTKSCDECRADLEAGLAGTIEYAVACAGACINEVQSECNSLQDDGSTCSSCSCKPCICTGLECVSVDETACEEQQKPDQFVGWCNIQTGDVQVRKVDQGSPGPDYAQGATATTEEVAFQETVRQCQTPIYVQTPAEPIPPIGVNSQSCNLGAYADGTSLTLLVNSLPNVFQKAGWAELADTIGKVGFEGISVSTVTQAIVGSTIAITKAPPAMAGILVPAIAAGLGCNNPEFVKAAEALAAFGMTQKVIGVDYMPWATRYIYSLNTSCRNKELEPDKALDCYLSNGMEKWELDTHFAINGLCTEATEFAIIAGRSKPEAEQLVMMRHRGIINSDQFAAGFRQLGYLDADTPQNIFAISEHLPDIATVNRMAQANVTDENAVTSLGLDEGNGQLLAGQLHDWLKGNGISDETIQKFWRAHWQTPNVANLFEFWHRLRDDKALNGNAELESAITSAYSANGIPPFWRKYFDAVKLSPLLKRDIRGAYASGALPDADLKRFLRLTGHDDESVEILIKELKPARRHAILSHTALRQWVEQALTASACIEQLKADGFEDATVTTAMRDIEWEFERSSWAESYSKGMMPRDSFVAFLTDQGVTSDGAIALANKLSFKIPDHQSVKDYLAGTVARSDARSFMLNSGMAMTSVDRLLNDADYAITDAAALECVRGVKQRYLMGEIDNVQARDILQQRGIDSSRAVQYVSGFDCQKSADGTKVAVEKLCHWLYLGTISQTEFADRLVRLGYTEENASLLLYDCVQANTMRDIKEAKRVSKELQSAADKQQRANDKLAASNQRAADRAARARSDKAKLRAARDRQLLGASEKVFKGTSSTLTSAVEAVKAGVALCSTQYGLGIDDCLKIALLASEQMQGLQLIDYTGLVTQLAEAAASDALAPSDADIGLVPSTNGLTQPSG